jgi:hemoglobin-like flavoprotein
MRCYLVTGPGAKRYAATNADARATREALVEQLGCKKKDVEIEPTDVPVAKALLLEFINALCAETDATGAAE